MEIQVEERFARIVREMAEELVIAHIKNAKMEKELSELKFRLLFGDCAKCGKHKLLPWKDDNIGNVCASCLYDITLVEKKENDWAIEHKQKLRNVVFSLLEHFGLEDNCGDEDLERADEIIIEHLETLNVPVPFEVDPTLKGYTGFNDINSKRLSIGDWVEYNDPEYCKHRGEVVGNSNGEYAISFEKWTTPFSELYVCLDGKILKDVERQ